MSDEESFNDSFKYFAPQPIFVSLSSLALARAMFSGQLDDPVCESRQLISPEAARPEKRKRRSKKKQRRLKLRRRR